MNVAVDETTDTMQVLRGICKNSALKYPDDITKALSHATTKATADGCLEALQHELVQAALREIIYDCRHVENGVIKRSLGMYGGPSKVKPDETVNQICRSVYLYMIAGRSLGTIRGEELDDIENGEAERAAGHDFNSRLCRALKRKVKADKTVQECVSERVLSKMFADLQK